MYFIGKSFYTLAADYGKHQWGFAILGVVTYYACTFTFGILLGIAMAFYDLDALERMSDFVLGLIAVPVGLLGALGLYYILKAVWERNRNMTNELRDNFKD